MKTTIISLAVSSLFLLSCGNTSNDKSNERNQKISHEEIQHNHENQAIELNNGEKWKVNAGMTPYILEGNKILNEYNNGNYIELAEQLKNSNKGLIKSCTMDGKSHEELHKWLNPHMQLLDKLGNADSEKEAIEIIAQLKKSFQTYHTYFQ